MEIVVIVIVVVFLLVVIGQVKGAPGPEGMTDGDLIQRLQSEGAWISKYLSQPYQVQQSESLKRMYNEKTAYVQSLKAEFMRRQVAQVSNSVQQEMSPIIQRASELIKEGVPEAEANATALREWQSKSK
jgi:hypothetical protein